MLETFFSGVILGILIAAPVGPIGILCMKNTLQYGKTSGFLTGLGASFADATYGVIAVIGLGIMSQFLLEYKIIIQMLGILFLLYISIQILKSKQNSQELGIQHSSLLKDFSTTYFLTLGNPLTILSFIGIFSGLGSLGESLINKSLLVIGVWAGSLTWWIILIHTISLIGHHLSDSQKHKITLFSGIFLLCYTFHLGIKLFFS